MNVTANVWHKGECMENEAGIELSLTGIFGSESLAFFFRLPPTACLLPPNDPALVNLLEVQTIVTLKFSAN